MADVRPFAALRPRAGLAPRVAAVPYDVVNAEEARALATDALSFLHVSRAEIDLPPDTDPYADAVYAQAVKAGAIGVSEPADMFWGARFAQLRDPFGHLWMLNAQK